MVRSDPDGNVASNDIAIRRDGTISEAIHRYHDVLLGLEGRRGIRDDITRYESVALAFVHPRPPAIATEWPPESSPLRFERAFASLYRAYQAVEKLTRHSTSDASRLNARLEARSSLRFARNSAAIAHSRALSAGRLTRLGAHASLSTACYDQRYVFAAPKLASRTTRWEWSEDSPACREAAPMDCEPRLR